MISIVIVYFITLFACIDFRFYHRSEITDRYAHISYPTKSSDTFLFQRLDLSIKIRKKVPFLCLLGALYVSEPVQII